LAVAKSKNRDAIPTLLEMLEDDNFTGFAAAGLGILHAEEAIPRLKALADGCSNAWVRREAKTALKKLGVTDDGIKRIE
jgi:HEAT repeat protein